MPAYQDNEPALRAAEAEIARLQTHWPAELALLDSPSSSYYALPMLLIEAFPALQPDEVHPLMVFSRLLASSILWHDELADRAETPRVVTSLRIMAMQAEAYRAVHAIFPPAARFWDHLRADLADFMASCLDEQRFVTGERSLDDYSEALAMRIAAGKTGLSRSIVAGMVELARDDRPLEPLRQILDATHQAMQLLDDLQDWKEDLRRGIPSLLLSRIGARPVAADDEAAQRSAMTRLAREIYYGGHAIHVLDLALATLAATEAHRAAFPGLGLFKIVDTVRQRCASLRRDIDRIVGSNLRRSRRLPQLDVAPPAASDPWRPIAWDALGFLVRQWRLGFGEARDLIQYPERLGLGPPETCYFGDVFQRGLIAEALCDADAALGGPLQPVLQSEVEHLLEQRIDSATGGWRYYGNLPDLPPDADSLAQVTRILLRTGQRDAVVAHCEAPLGVLLEQNRHADGSFETWIIPTRMRTPLEERHAELVPAAGKSGPDCDVMANMMVSLRAYDAARFAGVLGPAAAYLTAQQGDDGTWPTRWYFGPSYGMYICLRALAAEPSAAAAVARTCEFLRRSQREDGGWGTGAASEALTTSLALLGLAAVQHMAGDRGDRQRAERALGFLRSQQDAERAWAAQKFINVGRKQYGSRTVTTAFVLRAALAWAPDDTPASGPAA